MNRPDDAVTLDGVLRHWLAVLLTRGFILVAFAVAGCGGGGSASSPPVGAAVDGSADTTGDENTDTTNPVVPAQPEPEPEPEPEIDPYEQWELLSKIGTEGSSDLDMDDFESADQNDRKNNNFQASDQKEDLQNNNNAVSYTHLTLPTILLV